MIKPFKKRHLDLTKPVRVHRNLHNKSYSIKQKGIVVAHATHLALVNCTFLVSMSGQGRVRKSGQKNVHAFIEGTISTNGTMGTSPESEEALPAKISYNPYDDEWFMCKVSCGKPFPIDTASGVIINSKGVTAAYTSRKTR